MTLYGSLIVYSICIFRTLLSNKSIFTPKNGNGNISYEGILKHRKYRRCDSFVLFFIDHESWRGHCPWIFFIQNHFTFSVIIIIFFNVVFLTTIFFNSIILRFIFKRTWTTGTGPSWAPVGIIFTYLECTGKSVGSTARFISKVKFSGKMYYINIDL
jgi:hypothetical protein